MNDFRVIIAGGRDFNDYALLKAKCDTILAEKAATRRIVIVSGAARGADSLGERYAREHGYALDSHPADWNRTYQKRSDGEQRRCTDCLLGREKSRYQKHD